ncbi:hypothetical protein [Aeromicrobium sp. P5_D10]
MTIDWEHLPSSGRRGQRTAYLLAGVMVLVALGSILYVSVGSVGPDKAKVRTVEGFAQMVADARDEFGTTEVLEASLYDTYAMVTVPVEGSARRTITYQYGGDFDDVFTKGQRDIDETTLIDLADVDAAAVLAFLKSAPKEVGLPDGKVSSVSIRMGTLPDNSDIEAASVYIRVDTEFDEYGSIQTDLSGKVVDIDRGDD